MIKSFFRETFFYRFWKEMKANYALHISGNPSQYMTVIGVTGTNGKTTTCSLIHHLLGSIGIKSVYVGTTGVMIGDQELTGVKKMTSYDPVALQNILVKAYEAGCTHAVLEVSSHGLHQKRFKGIGFSVAVLTNISDEHLDYHKTVTAYAAEKQKLFRRLQESKKEPRAAILPADDSRGRKRGDRMQFGMKLMYGLKQAGGLKMTNVVQGKDSTSAEILHLGKSYAVTLPMLGMFNMYNALAAIGAVTSLGKSVKELLPGLQSFKQVAGRQERYTYNNIDWFIDYAHTPHGLEVMLTYLKKISTGGRVFCVFGAPGERDKGKRPEMGKIVDRFADVVIVTDDDAAGENRRDILRDVAVGISRDIGDNYYIVPSREGAIRLAAQMAQPGDVVLLAGIGHQDILDTNFGYIPRSEKEKIKEAYMTLSS